MQKRGNTKQITNKLIMQWKINNMVICLWMGKNLTAKTHRVIFKSPLPKLHYYHNKRLQARNPKYLTNLHLNPYPNTQSDLFCSDSFPFWCTAPKYMTNGWADPSTRLQNTNLKRLLAVKFFNSSTRWRSGRWHDEDQEDAWSQNPMVQIHSNFSKREREREREREMN